MSFTTRAVTSSPGQMTSVGPGKVPSYVSVVYRPPATCTAPVDMRSVVRSCPCALNRSAGSGKPSRMTSGKRAAQRPPGVRACSPMANGSPTVIDPTTTNAAPAAVSAARREATAAQCSFLPVCDFTSRVDHSRPAGHTSIDHLPEGVLAADLVAVELEQVAAAHLDGLTVQLSAANRPLGYAAVTARPVALVAVADVRDPIEPRLDPFSDLLLTDQVAPSGRRPAGRVQDTIFSEERHDSVDIVSVECLEKRLQRRRRCPCRRHEDGS